jgi:hypothetical protein
MSAPARLAAFGAVLTVLFAGGALAGATIGPDRDTHRPAKPQHAGMTSAHAEGHGAAPEVRGLAVAEDGMRVVVADPELRRERSEKVAFRIVDAHGATIRHFDVGHTKRMHLIVARRDLTGFQHVHPEQRPDGTWATTLRLPQAGSYRLFADFSRNGKPQTLATDLRVDGAADLRPLPAPHRTAVSDGGYDVRLDAGTARPGRQATLRFTISHSGRLVRTQPYLGAGGHLVALRDGDLAFLHVHPTEHGADDTAAIAFAATFPTVGHYRLFLQFQHAGRVHTVAFTQAVR